MTFLLVPPPIGRGGTGRLLRTRRRRGSCQHVHRHSDQRARIRDGAVQGRHLLQKGKRRVLRTRRCRPADDSIRLFVQRNSEGHRRDDSIRLFVRRNSEGHRRFLGRRSIRSEAGRNSRYRMRPVRSIHRARREARRRRRQARPLRQRIPLTSRGSQPRVARMARFHTAHSTKEPARRHRPVAGPAAVVSTDIAIPK